VRGDILECRRAHRSGEYRGGHSGDILQLLPLGDHLLSLGRDGLLLLWRVGQYDGPEASLRLPAGFAPTCMTHPDTYVNKVLVGAADGRMQLWNFAAGRLLHEFPGWGSAVRCLKASPALDVVGIGMEDGCAFLFVLVDF
jgi:U3 small nucleolar RNA-associated protein 21